MHPAAYYVDWSFHARTLRGGNRISASSCSVQSKFKCDSELAGGSPSETRTNGRSESRCQAGASAATVLQLEPVLSGNRRDACVDNSSSRRLARNRPASIARSGTSERGVGPYFIAGSALGHKRTLATAKADSRKGLCLLYP